jgi:hypothetical protein
MAVGSFPIGGLPIGAARRRRRVVIVVPPPQIGSTGRILASPKRKRLISWSEGKMRLAAAFAPIEAGQEIDDFVFDFTPDVGAAAILSAAWTCRLSPFSPGFDPDPMSRILTSQTQTLLYDRDILGNLQLKTGAFAMARIGGMPVSAAGATYILDVVVSLSDGRMIALNATLPCVLPGQ